MPRKIISGDPAYPVHVTSRSNNREQFPLPLSEIWPIFEDYLYLAKVGFGLKIHSFVLMPNHFHLIATAPLNNMSMALKYCLREISREISRRSKTRNHQFGNRCFRCSITSYHYYMHAYKYVYQNPVAANLCSRAEKYPYSTLSGLLGSARLYIPVEEDLLLENDFEGTLRWLNDRPEKEHQIVIKKALRRGLFKLPKNKSGGFSPLETHFY